MPKKTRQEKIIAELRRKLKDTQQTGVQLTPYHTEKSRVSPPVPNIARNETQKNSVTGYSYVLEDLRRISLLTIVAVGLETVLYILLPRLNLIFGR